MKPAWPLGRELCQYEYNVSSTYASRSQTLSTTFARSFSITFFLCPSQGPSVMQDIIKIKKWVGGWMRVDFPKKSYVHVQKQKCGISNDVFFAQAELRKFKSQYIVLNWGTSSHSILGCAVLNYAILAVAPTGIVLVCSVLIKHNRISWRVTRIRTLGKYHDRRPQGQSFIKGQYVETKATS